MYTFATGVRHFVSTLADAVPLLELNVDGVRDLMACADVDPDSVSLQLGPERDEHAAQLPLESLVEVEVDERVVDVGAFGEEGGENEALGSHVLVLLVENEEEGHDGVRGPGNHKTEADAEKHLEEEVTNNRKLLSSLEPVQHTLNESLLMMCTREG